MTRAAANSVRPETLPRLALGQLDALSRCSRRLARALSDDRPASRMSDARTRLGNAVGEALRSAHTIVETTGGHLDDVVERRVPAELGVEEGVRYREFIAHYVDAFGDRSATLDVRSGATLGPRASACGRFALSGRIDVLVREEDGMLTVRRVHARQPASNGWDGAIALLLGEATGRADNDPVLRISRVWGGELPGASDHVITRGEASAARSRLLSLVDDALVAPSATAGWWCTTCPALRGCDGVTETSIESVLAGFAMSSAAVPSAAP